MQRSSLAALFALVLAACGGDSTTRPPSVSTVQLTPTTATPFRTLGRTLQLSASARTSGGESVDGITFTWSSSNSSVASVSGTGLVTAIGNGTTNITATAQPGTIASTPIAVVVDQLAAELRVTPAQLSFGALGSTRQLVASLRDSLGNALSAAPTVTWTLGGTALGRVGVSPSGLVTALAIGTGDSVVANASGFTTKVPAIVTQVPASVLVNALGRDTIETTGVTRAFSAAARDSNNNTIAGASLTWSSTDLAVAGVSGSGVATAIGDGTTSIRATAGSAIGSRNLIVRRYASVFTLTPASGSITTPSGTVVLTGNARDSSDALLPITWLSRSTTIATASPSSGTSTTVTGRANGSTFIVMTAGTRTDSAGVAVSGQPSAPNTAAVTIGDNFFRSVRNSTQNTAIDTVAVGGVVTWTWTGSNLHSVQSIFSPSFVSSALLSAGTFNMTFTEAGTYQYDCQVHPSMTGRIIVR